MSRCESPFTHKGLNSGRNYGGSWNPGCCPRCRRSDLAFIAEVILIATGSEVSLALEAHARLAGDGIQSRVVSMPCWELFERQPESYRDTVLPPSVRARVSIEAAAPFGSNEVAWDA
jgi:transketolase